MTCSTDNIEVDVVMELAFTFSCTLTTDTDSDFMAKIEWQTMSIFSSKSSLQLLTFDESSGDTQTVTFTGTVLKTGKANLVIVAREPGAPEVMDTYTIKLNAFNSSLNDDAESGFASVVTKAMDNPLGQAFVGIGVLGVLMGLLVMRGQKRNNLIEEARQHQKEEIMRQRSMQAKRFPPPPPRL